MIWLLGGRKPVSVLFPSTLEPLTNNLNHEQKQQHTNQTLNASIETSCDLRLSSSPGRPELRQLVLEYIPDVVVLDIIARRFPTGLSALGFCLEVHSIGSIHRLRNQVLSGDLEKRINVNIRNRSSDPSWQVELDRTKFFRWYEDTLLQLKELTPQQKKCLRDIDRFDAVHLSAPPGAGKTFVAVQRVMDALVANDSAHVLYVSHTSELVYHFIQWLVARLASHMQVESRKAISKFLDRLVILKKPFCTFFSPKLKNDRIELASARKVDLFELQVVDEAHSIYRRNVERNRLDEVSSSKRLVLSDSFSSSAAEVNIPSMKSLELTEVVRSSWLKSFIFEASREEDLMLQYAKHVADAIVHVAEEHPGISLHKRTALLVPDADFLRHLKKALKPQLQRRLPQKHYRFDTFAESLCCLPERFRRLWTQPLQDEHLILDTIKVADGLHQLIVVCIGLDAPIEAASDLTTYADLYKGIMRAQLKAIVVNVHVSSGWFEFHGRDDPKLPEDGAAKYRSRAATEICQAAVALQPSLPGIHQAIAETSPEMLLDPMAQDGGCCSVCPCDRVVVHKPLHKSKTESHLRHQEKASK